MEVLGINRTTVELKRVSALNLNNERGSINRTTVELKRNI